MTDRSFLQRKVLLVALVLLGCAALGGCRARPGQPSAPAVPSAPPIPVIRAVAGSCLVSFGVPTCGANLHQDAAAA